GTPFLFIALIDLSVFALTFDGTSESARKRTSDPLGIETASPEIKSAIQKSRILSMSPWTDYSRSLMLPNTNLLTKTRSLNGYYPLNTKKLQTLFGFDSTVPFHLSDYFLYENRLLSTFGVGYVVGWDSRLGEAVRNWPWHTWASDDSKVTRITNMQPAAIAGAAQWNNGIGILKCDGKSTPALIFKLAGSGFKTFKCSFSIRAQRICDGNLNIIAVAKSNPNKLLAERSIGPHSITPQFHSEKLDFVNIEKNEIELHFYSRSRNPIEINEISVEENGPPLASKSNSRSIANSINSPYEIVHSFYVPSELSQKNHMKFCIAKNHNAASLVHLVFHIIPVENFEEACSIMKDPNSNFNPLIDAIVEIPENVKVAALSAGTAEIVKEGINQFEIYCNAQGPSFLVFLDSYRQGWNAKVNGEPVKIYKTNGLAKGVFVPKGSSIIEFSYFPPGLKTGLIITIIAVLICIIILFLPS
ncbi:MAG: YfhO family protein, partial [Candidatus Hodarchaeota archaeon]